MWALMLQRVAQQLARMKAFQEGIVVGATVICSFFAPEVDKKVDNVWEYIDQYLEESVDQKEDIDAE